MLKTFHHGGMLSKRPVGMRNLPFAARQTVDFDTMPQGNLVKSAVFFASDIVLLIIGQDRRVSGVVDHHLFIRPFGLFNDHASE